ncbi:hypothetical protein KC348_g9 [Hortaea werneckii]|nr:hypothetical protein KC348_g9 [Hortaea werneckii]
MVLEAFWLAAIDPFKSTRGCLSGLLHPSSRVTKALSVPRDSLFQQHNTSISKDYLFHKLCRFQIALILVLKHGTSLNLLANESVIGAVTYQEAEI